MSLDLHHVHVFASNIDETIQWWRRHMDAKIIFDDELAGARNVFLAVGSGRLHLYDQAPRDRGRGSVHHLGVKVANLRVLLQSVAACGGVTQRDLRSKIRMTKIGFSEFI